MVCVGGLVRARVGWSGIRESEQQDKQVKTQGTETRASSSVWLEHGQKWGGEQKIRPNSTLERV